MIGQGQFVKLLMFYFLASFLGSFTLLSLNNEPSHGDNGSLSKSIYLLETVERTLPSFYL